MEISDLTTSGTLLISEVTITDVPESEPEAPALGAA
jgi:hypothetical protein